MALLKAASCPSSVTRGAPSATRQMRVRSRPAVTISLCLRSPRRLSPNPRDLSTSILAIRERPEPCCPIDRTRNDEATVRAKHSSRNRGFMAHESYVFATSPVQTCTVSSFIDVSMYCPSRAKERLLQPSIRFQDNQLISRRRAPKPCRTVGSCREQGIAAGLNRTSLTAEVWPFSSLISLPVAVSHMAMVPPRDPVAMKWPSALKAASCSWPA